MIKFLTYIGKGASWLCLLIILLMCFDVMMRYLFNSTQVWMIELEWYLFGVLFLLTGAWTWIEDRHVRVDVFYTNFKPSIKRLINLFGHVFLALPWILVVMFASFKYAGYSWAWGEGSPDPGGLPARYLIKYMLTIGFLLMLLAVIHHLSDYPKALNNKE